ncbi:hypothetical protein L1887_38789 [Cichorium endivia]|nr:hypothetical protein L1887_38789 [Cichorium endivia]
MEDGDCFSGWRRRRCESHRWLTAAAKEADAYNASGSKRGRCAGRRRRGNFGRCQKQPDAPLWNIMWATEMPAYSVLSTYFSFTLPPRLPSPNRLLHSTLPLSRSLAYRNLRYTCIVASLRRNAHGNYLPVPASTNCSTSKNILDSFVTFSTSRALFVCIFVTSSIEACATEGIDY